MTLAELRAKCPGGWVELTLGQYQSIYKDWNIEKEPHERDYFKLLEILCGFHDPNVTPEKEEAIYQLTRWVNEDPITYSREVPKSINLDGRVIEIEKVEELSIGQNILVKQALDKAKYLDECISTALAIYLQPKYDGEKFDLKKAQRLEAELLKMKASELYGLGFFLLNRALKRGRISPMRWSLTRSNLINRLRRMFPQWQRAPL